MKKKIIKWIVIISAFYIFVTLTIISPSLLMGKSMYPTYPNEGITLTYKLVYPVLLEKIGLLHNQIERFDIVYLKSNDGNRMAKRVIGLPGETISC